MKEWITENPNLWASMLALFVWLVLNPIMLGIATGLCKKRNGYYDPDTLLLGIIVAPLSLFCSCAYILFHIAQTIALRISGEK